MNRAIRNDRLRSLGNNSRSRIISFVIFTCMPQGVRVKVPIPTIALVNHNNGVLKSVVCLATWSALYLLSKITSTSVSNILPLDSQIYKQISRKKAIESKHFHKHKI